MTERGEYSKTSSAADCAASSTTPRACASWIRLFTLLPGERRLDRDRLRRVRAMTSRSPSWMTTSRSGKLRAAPRVDRALLDEREPPALVVDDSEAGGDGARVDAEDAHWEIMKRRLSE